MQKSAFSKGGNPWQVKVFKRVEEFTKSPCISSARAIVRAIIDHQDKMEAISLLVDNPKLGASVIQSLFNVIAGDDVHLLVEFLGYLGNDKLNVGSTKLSVILCYEIAFSVSGLLRTLDATLNGLSEGEKLTVAWFLVQVCKSSATARANEKVISIASKLKSLKGDVIQAMVNVILPSQTTSPASAAIVSSQTMRSLDSIRALEPVHDNDFPFDFREINIIPTADEVNKAIPFTGLVRIDVQEAAMLDRQFRLLREDMVAPILEEVQELDVSKATNPTNSRDHRAAALAANKRKRMYHNPVLVDIAFEPLACILMLVPIPSPLQARLNGMKSSERGAFMDGAGRRVLAKDSLILFLSAEFQVRCVARIVRRDKNDFLKHNGFFCVGVEFSAAQLPSVLSAIQFDALGRMESHDNKKNDKNDKNDKNKNEKSDKNEKNGSKKSAPAEAAVPPFVFDVSECFSPMVFQANSSVFSYEPVLRCLQDMVAIPFREELVLGQPPLPLGTSVSLSSAVRNALASDRNQLEAVSSALTKRVCLIQGPPGTGKTYVGVQIVRALLDDAKRTGEEVRILCLCYTNHALDDFLLSLHEEGGMSLDTFVRLGMSPKIHEKLQPRCLDRLEQSKFDRVQNRRFAALKQEQTDCAKNIGALKRQIGNAGGAKWNWAVTTEFFTSQTAIYDDQLALEWEELQPIHSAGFTETSKDVRWKSWCVGKADPYANTLIPQAGSIWALSQRDRQQRLSEWRTQYLEILRDELTTELMRSHRLNSELQLLKSEFKVPSAASSKVLGCTTTAAAKNRDLLAQMRPTIVLVEEAGEILEASVLTALGPSVQQLIMIGDHQQLRPKLESYQLRKESGKGVNFDVSLFERLALQPGFPIITLSKQRRMRPEICDLIRLTTYPALQDHPSVIGRDDILGVSKNVFFIDHNHHEGADETSALLGGSSKINGHEAGMVREMVRYFMLQGYKAEEIVVLTPYLGQLVLIQAELRKIKLRAEINDLDRQELQSADVNLDDNMSPNPHEKASSAPQMEMSVRVSTVDNYQGEESRIIIASLVRCNPAGEVGFVAGAERVNVMLSRARDGFALIGSATTLRKAKAKVGNADWNKILDHLSSTVSVFSGFPARCTAHNAISDEPIDAPEMFGVCSPCGGCTQTCGVTLPMCPLRHPCSKTCHPTLDPLTKRDVHATMTCVFKVEEECKNGHKVHRECCKSKPEQCRVKVAAQCAAGLHTIEQFCYETAVKCCFACKVAAKKRAAAEEQLRREQLEQAALLAKAHEENTEVANALQRAVQHREHAEQLARVQHEKELMEGELVKQRQPVRRAAPAPAAFVRPLSPSLDDAMSKLSISLPPPPQTSRPKKAGDRGAARSSSKPSMDAADHQPVIDHIPHIPTMEERPPNSRNPPRGSTESTRNSHCGVKLAPSRSPNNNSDDEDISGGGVSGGCGSGKIGGGGEVSSTNSDIDGSSRKTPLRPPVAKQSTTQQLPAPKSAPVPAPAPSASKPSSGPSPAALAQLMQLAAAEQWMKVFNHSCARPEVLRVRPETAVQWIGVRALVLLAEESCNPSEDVKQSCKKVDSLQSDFTDGLLLLPNIGSDENVINYVRVLLQYVIFVLYARNQDFPYSASEAGSSFRTLLQLRARAQDPCLAPIPSAWLEAVNKFDPSKVKAVSVSQSSASIKPRSRAQEAWDICVAEFLANENKKKPSARPKKAPAPKTSPSAAVDTLMKLTGLETVKQCIVDQYNKIIMTSKQGVPISSASYNLRCDGNPGTGKTTVARLYSAFLVDIGVLPEGCGMKETSGSKLISDGVSGLTRMLVEMKEQGGGVVFVDETYQLNPHTDQSGRQVLDFILPHAEKLAGEYGSIVWVFAGYADRMDKLYEHNPGLPSRFPHKLVFEDYSDEELLSVMLSLMARGGQDVSAPAPQPAATAKPKKPASVPVAQPYQYNRYGSSYPDIDDQWGNTWTWDQSQHTYKDDFGNISGYGPKSTSNPHNHYYEIGTQQNPIVDQSAGISWLYDGARDVFYQQQNPATVQGWYPGSPKPAPPKAAVRPFTADIKWVRVATRRLGRMRGKVGFGNARAVRILFGQAHARQTRRLTELKNGGDTSADIMHFTRDDLLGPKANRDSLIASCEAWKKLQAMTGLKEVKDELNKTIELAVVNADLEDQELPLRGVALNRIFLGNPGTGKTTVAALYGQILCHLGLLSKGDVVLKNSSDFIGSVMGSSENQTRSILAASEGCVLVIDEAYSLNPSYGSKAGGGSGGAQDPYRTAVIDTIVEQVQGRPGEDRAVVMLGYRKEMEDMLAAANPGLSRRFQLEYAFEFADYTDEQLTKILLNKCKEGKIHIDMQTAAFAITQLAKARSMPHFGNAGAVDNLLSIAKVNMGARSELRAEDFCIGGKLPPKSGNEADLFADLVADDSILDYLKKLQSSIKLAQRKGKDPKANVQFNLRFVGAPGTGKTTIARKMGQIYHSLGLLPTCDVVEVKAADLIAGYVGQSQKKASEVLHRAKGKVLFIDEAYQLNPAKGGPFMQEAVDTLVQELTSEELKGKLVVILAGYEADIEELMTVNSGLSSRFSKTLYFENFSEERVLELLHKKLAENDLELGVEAYEYLPKVAAQLCKIPEFSNGRDVETFAKNVFDAFAQRTGDEEEDNVPLEPEDLDAALKEMLSSRKGVARPHMTSASGPPAQLPPKRFALPFAQASPPPPPAPAIQMQRAQAAAEPSEDVVELEEQPVSTPFLKHLQDLLDKKGLNSREGVKRLSELDINHPDMVNLAGEIAKLLKIDFRAAQDLLQEWQSKQLDVQEKMREQEEEMAMAKKEKRQALVPIWRCAVCGQADLNYIYCYVSPYIVRYDLVDAK